MVKAMILNMSASRSPSMASPAYQISWKSTNRFKSYYGGTHRHTQTGWWFDKPTSISL